MLKKYHKTANRTIERSIHQHAQHELLPNYRY